MSTFLGHKASQKQNRHDDLRSGQGKEAHAMICNEGQ
jgi:hypothetical protein